MRVRIGLHSGLVVVGNIGAPGRVNYTVVGDAVNQNAAWFYAEPKEAAKQIKGRVAFWKGVQVG